MSAPWSDCKVAFPIDDDDAIWDVLFEQDLDILPDGWDLVETDCSGARCVAIFRVSGVPAVNDGTIVKNLLAQIQAGAFS